MIDNWKYYNHAVVPITAPHENPDLKPIEDNSIWKNWGGIPLLARWTSDWDCGYETEWWYCIKDTPFDISTLKSKRRYEINKGNKNFEVREINPEQYGDNIFNIAVEAYKTYPSSYRPNIKHDSYVEEVKKWNDYKNYGAFSKEDGHMYGWTRIRRSGQYIDFTGMKADPSKEHLGINAAIVYKFLIDHEEFLRDGGYICDGARSIQHETAFQDYLEKYFGFRKAYCRLHIVYNPSYRWLFSLEYCFRGILGRMNRFKQIKRINSLLTMEKIRRSFE